jgi:hypothetical protein
MRTIAVYTFGLLIIFEDNGTVFSLRDWRIRSKLLIRAVKLKWNILNYLDIQWYRNIPVTHIFLLENVRY